MHMLSNLFFGELECRFGSYWQKWFQGDLPLFGNRCWHCLGNYLHFKSNESKWEVLHLWIKCIIDHVFIVKSWGHLVSVAEVKIPTAPDHRAVRLGVKKAINKRGSGLKKFNNSLMKDQPFRMLIENSNPMIKVEYRKV